MPEIYSIDSNETEIEQNESVIEDEWCPENKTLSRQELWVNALTLELAEVAAFDPRPHGTRCQPEKPKWFYCHSVNKWVDMNPHQAESVASQPPSELPAFQAVHWEDNHLGVDLRPHIYDEKMEKFLLVGTEEYVSFWASGREKRLASRLYLSCLACLHGFNWIYDTAQRSRRTEMNIVILLENTTR